MFKIDCVEQAARVDEAARSMRDEAIRRELETLAEQWRELGRQMAALDGWMPPTTDAWPGLAKALP